jgi:hypothetical protein
MRSVTLFLFVGLTSCVGGELAGGVDGGPSPGNGNDGECSPGERRCLGDSKTQRCSDAGQWSVPRNCVNGRCNEGVCTRSCEGACTPGQSQCTPSGLQTCARGATDCASWSPPVPCRGGDVCPEGGVSCVPERCQNQCENGALRCNGVAEYSECIQVGECTRWSDNQQCRASEVCSSGRCQPEGVECRDACVDGTFSCVDRSTFTRCSRQANGCLDYEASTACAGGQECDQESGRCEDVCPDPPRCRLIVERCFQGGVQICVPGFDGCPTWGAINSCPAGQTCEQAICLDSCQPQCQLGDRRCENDGVATCELINGCEDWGFPQACPGGRQCGGQGECIDACFDGAGMRPGDIESRECGVCGIEFRECQQGGQWGAWNECIELGACEPGEQRVCGRCGIQRCNQNCEWDPCQGEGICQPMDTEPCGECGVRECDNQCRWSECGNSNNDWRHCNECGWQFCLPDGQSYSDECAPQFDDACGEFGFCIVDGMCTVGV